MLRKKPLTADGAIELIEINKNQQVFSGKLIGKSAIKLRLGRIQGYVQASIQGYNTKLEFSGLIIGRIIIILRSGIVE